jgi:D-3-phosphoglycerate dehydrogenase
MADARVLVTDRAWPDLAVEARVLAEVGAVPFDAPAEDAATLAEHAADAVAILFCWADVPAAVLDAAERCQVVCRYGVGLDNVDLARATELGMVVTNIPDYCADEVAEHALALILALARGIVRYADQTSAGTWVPAGAGQLHRLRGSTLGIVGLGANGQALARRARGLGLRLLGYTTSATPPPAELGVELAGSLDELLAAADVVSLHVPLRESTRNLIGARELALMKPTALLVNTARGGVVDTAALAAALAAGAIAGAGLDVLGQEPPDPDDPLLALDNAIVTPHAAFYSEESVEDLRVRTARAAAAVLAGRVPQNVVNPQVLGSARARLDYAAASGEPA